MRCSRSRGVTLAEVLVASFVFSLLMTVAFQVLVPALRAWTDGQRRSEVSQSLLVTANWLGDDIVRSSPDSIQMTAENILVMRCALGQQADHNNEFDQLVAYWEKSGELFRGSKTLPPGTSGLGQLTMAELNTLKSKRRVGSNLELFDVKVTQPWKVDLHLKVLNEGRKGEILTSFSSMYAPFDPNVVEEDQNKPEPEPAQL